MRRYVKRTCAVALSVLMTASAFGCSSAKNTEEIPTLIEPQNAEVSTVRVERADVRVYKSETTRVEPKGEEVYFAMDGTVSKVFVKQGEYVTKGTLLAELSVEEYEESIPKLEEQLADLLESIEKENAQLDKRELEIQTDIAVLKREVRQTSGDARNQKRTQLEIKEIELERFNAEKESKVAAQQKQEADLREQLEELKEMKNSNQLFSPVDGYILNQPLNLIGERFHEEDAAFVIYNDSQLFVSGQYFSEAKFDKMPEHYALIDGQRVELDYIELTEEQKKQLSVKAVPGSNISKRVQYQLKPEEGQEIHFGDYAMIFFVTEVRENVLTLPTDLVRLEGGGYHVFVYRDGVRKEVEVIPGLRDECRVEILSGLEEGDIVYAQY
ncbi:MAG: biotin/lipoyl-binding protein [Lachnospiraceae bacterium]|nr:biotin/lipoyl-binding protein [Lachnospiraceae bacterium]